jgi:ATP-dependent exoDNAse (exonuclease V) alpha subunit
MVEYVLSAGNLKIVEGAAGAGKSFSLERAKDIFESKGFSILGLAPTGIAAENLNDNKINTMTVDKYFFDKNNGQNHVEIDENTIVIVDEAGMLGSRKMGEILKEIKDKNAKIILVGDSNQLQPIDYGGAFKSLKDRFDSIEMVETNRQKIEWQKSAANLIRSGQTNEALLKYFEHDKLSVDKTHNAAKAKIVKEYLKERALEPNKSRIVMSFYNRDVDHINAMIHNELKNKSEITSSHYFEIEDKNKKIQKKELKEFSLGEKILFTKNSAEFGVKNGSLGTLLEVKDECLKKTLKIKLNDEKTVEIDPQKYKSFDYGYAITIHKSQGTTFDSAKVLLTENIDKELFYVAATRQRENLNLYISQESFSSLEETNTHGKKQFVDVIYALTKSTKRSSLKSTSLDAITSPNKKLKMNLKSIDNEL